MIGPAVWPPILDRHTHTEFVLYRYIYTSWLPGFAQTLPLSPSLPFVPPFYPPSLGLPGFGQNICSFIAQNNSILEIHLKKFTYGPVQASQAWHRAWLGAWPRYAPVYTIGAGHRANSIINMAALNLRHVVRVLIAFLQFRRCHRASLQQLRQ